MRQHPDDDRDDQDLNEELGTPVYQGTGLSVRALTAEELDRFLDTNADQPARPVGSGWTALDPAPPLGVPRVPPPAVDPTGPAGVPATPPSGSLGAPGRSALAAYRRRRASELAAWTHTLAWRRPRWSAGDSGFAPPSRRAPGTGALQGSVAPPACSAGWPAMATSCSTTWPCPARTPMWITW
jgi:hypothetical protein